MKSAAELIKTGQKLMNPRYEMETALAMQIAETTTSRTEAASDGFYIGYLRGVRAERNRQRKRAAAAKA